MFILKIHTIGVDFATDLGADFECEHTLRLFIVSGVTLWVDVECKYRWQATFHTSSGFTPSRLEPCKVTFERTALTYCFL